MKKYLFMICGLLMLLMQQGTGTTPPVVACTPAEGGATPLPSVKFNVGGYADQTSVTQGKSITFYIATDVSPFDLKIVNVADSATVLTTIAHLTSTAQDCTEMYQQGCGWAATTTFTIPADWSSGMYAAQFPTTQGTRNLIFVVKPARPAVTSTILMVSAMNTYQAYNAFGDKSVYDRGSTDEKRSSQVSFNRPYLQNSGMGDLPSWEMPFIVWMNTQKRPFEMVADNDLENPDLLGHYKLVLIVGHSEYWLLAMRHNLEQYSQSGGHIAILGGNTMWWQIRYADNARTMIVYKDAAQDPMTGKNNDVVTVNWFDWPVNNPENPITGASFRWAGYANKAENDYSLRPVDQRIPYTVIESDHWLLQGSGLKPGDTFGKAAAGLETDGALYNCDKNGQSARVDGSDGTPLNYHILATLPGSNGHGTIGIYTNAAGGAVFNGATQGWAPALGVDPTITLITSRLLDRLADGKPLSYDRVTSPYITQEQFDCEQQPNVQFPGWRIQGPASQAKLTHDCAKEGPAGLQLIAPGDKPTGLIRNFAPTGKLFSAVYTRFSLNIGSLKSSEATFNMMDLRNTQQYNVDPKVRLQMRSGATGISIRVQQISTGIGTDWTPLGAGWQTIQVGWKSRGMISLSLNGKSAGTIDNPAGEAVNELRFTLAQDKASTPLAGYMCIDSIAVSANPINN